MGRREREGARRRARLPRARDDERGRRALARLRGRRAGARRRDGRGGRTHRARRRRARHGRPRGGATATPSARRAPRGTPGSSASTSRTRPRRGCCRSTSRSRTIAAIRAAVPELVINARVDVFLGIGRGDRRRGGRARQRLPARRRGLRLPDPLPARRRSRTLALRSTGRSTCSPSRGRPRPAELQALGVARMTWGGGPGATARTPRRRGSPRAALQRWMTRAPRPRVR